MDTCLAVGWLDIENLLGWLKIPFSFSYSIIQSFYHSYFFLLVGNSLLVVLFYIIITQSNTEKSQRFTENKVMSAFRDVSH